MLSLTRLAVDHGKLRALWDVSMHVGHGERVALLGANGAGKSTAMGAIVGLYADALRVADRALSLAFAAEVRRAAAVRSAADRSRAVDAAGDAETTRLRDGDHRQVASRVGLADHGRQGCGRDGGRPEQCGLYEADCERAADARI